MSHRRLRHLPFSLGSGTTGAKLVLYAPAMRGYADGDPVGTWSDVSRQGNNSTASGTDRPTYKAAFQGGMPVVQYTADGSKNLTLQNYVTGTTLFFVLNQVYAQGSYAPFLLGSTDFYNYHRGATNSLWDYGLALGITATRINGGPLYTNTTDLPLVPLVLTVNTTGIASFNRLSRDRTYGRSWLGWYGLIISYDAILGDAGALSKRIQQSSGFTFRIATK